MLGDILPGSASGLRPMDEALGPAERGLEIPSTGPGAQPPSRIAESPAPAAGTAPAELSPTQAAEESPSPAPEEAPEPVSDEQPPRSDLPAEGEVRTVTPPWRSALRAFVLTVKKRLRILPADPPES